jgi:hypothetical protein
MPLSAARCGKYAPKFEIVADRCGGALGGFTVSVLTQRFADPALGEIVLADDALGVDPQ